MANNAKTFLVSTADFAFYVKGALACTGTTNLNTSLEVSMQEQNVNAGKGNKLVYSYKYGRELSATLEAADWKLEFIAANTGSSITEGLSDVYHIAECVTMMAGIGTLNSVPIGDIAVELPNGSITTVTPTGSTIDLSGSGITTETVQATYKFSTLAKTVTVDADSVPYVGELILTADKHSNTLGKVGSVQIIIPSYQLSGNFSINFTPDGVTSTNLDGKALAVTSERCIGGPTVYAYIKEFDTTASAISVNDIAVTPSLLTLTANEDRTISVIGLKGGMYAPVQLENKDCTFTSEDAGVATVGPQDGIVHGVAAGTTLIHISYDGHKDVAQVTVA